MTQTLQQDKFEDVDLKHDNNIFKFQSKNTQIRYFWYQIEGVLFCTKSLQSGKFKVFLNVSIFKVGTKLCILKYLRELIRKMEIVFFQIPANSIQIQNFL